MVSGGAAALLSSVQRKGEGSQTQSRGTSRKRTRRQPNSLHSPTRARSGRGNSRYFGSNSPPSVAPLSCLTRLSWPTFLWDIRSGGTAGGDEARGCADGKQSAARPDARAGARRAPCTRWTSRRRNSGGNYPLLFGSFSRAQRRTKPEFMDSVCVCVCVSVTITYSLIHLSHVITPKSER